MRPLRLQVEGFACFKDRQELDLSSLDFFAITGPTGAGKSSLLDAMLFALFGVIPRVGAQNHDELISHGRPRMAVTLDFRTGGRLFRVTRARRRKGPAQAQLEELRDGAERPIADGVTTVEAEIRKQLGLSYDAFAQAVVLPQGEFMRFLKPESPGKRRVILRDLLRLGVYERMRQRASASQLEQRISELDRRLREDYVGATPEALAALRESHTQIVQDLSVATAELEQGRRTLDALRLVHRLALELVARRAELSRLTARTPEITAAEARVEAARRAVPVIALARAADESCRRAETLATRLAEAGEVRTRAEARHIETRERLAEAEAAGAAIAPLWDRLRQLDEVAGLVQARSAALARQAKAQEEHECFLGDHRSAVVEAQAAGARAETRARALAEADGQVREIPYDAELAARLDSVRDAATALAALRRYALSLEAAALRAEKAARAAAMEVARRQREAEEAARQHSDALRQLEVADLAWHQTERARARGARAQKRAEARGALPGMRPARDSGPGGPCAAGTRETRSGSGNRADRRGARPRGCGGDPDRGGRGGGARRRGEAGEGPGAGGGHPGASGVGHGRGIPRRRRGDARGGRAGTDPGDAGGRVRPAAGRPACGTRVRRDSLPARRAGARCGAARGQAGPAAGGGPESPGRCRGGADEGGQGGGRAARRRNQTGDRGSRSGGRARACSGGA
jgi:DNA repair exonuclease SbcCD ATPase subunit